MGVGVGGAGGGGGGRPSHLCAACQYTWQREPWCLQADT